MIITDPIAVLRLLSEHDVRFVLIGGQAARAHGSPSVTEDLDICYDRAAENLERLAQALSSVEARLRGVPDDLPFVLDAQTLRNGDTFTLSTTVGAIDVLGTPSGTDGYRDLRANAVEMHISDVPVLVASLEDLIRMKTAAGRPKDRIEVEILAALREERDGRARP